jgi:hypothetical protein
MLEGLRHDWAQALQYALYRFTAISTVLTTVLT